MLYNDILESITRNVRGVLMAGLKSVFCALKRPSFVEIIRSVTWIFGGGTSYYSLFLRNGTVSLILPLC